MNGRRLSDAGHLACRGRVGDRLLGGCMPMSHSGDGDERHDGADVVHEFWSRVSAGEDAVVVYVGDPRGEEIAQRRGRS